MTQTTILRPTDPYSPLWPAYWAANPHLLRGVGAEANEGGGDGGGQGAEGQGGAEGGQGGGGEGGAGGGAEGQRQAQTGNDAWYAGIQDEGLRGTAAKFADQKAFLDAVGVKVPSGEDWRSLIKDEKLRDHAGRFTSLDDLVKGNADLRADRDRLRSTAIVPPGKDAKPEEVTAYRKAMGIPETPEGYKFPDLPPERMTDEVKAERAAWAKEFHDAGLPAATAERLMAKFAEVAAAKEKSLVEQDKAFAEKAEEALKQEWPGDEYARNRTFANRAATQLLGADLDAAKKLETKDGRFVLDHPVMLKMLAKVGREMGESGLGSVMTDGEREGIEGQIRDLRKQISEAQQKGESRRANDLYRREQALLAKMRGSQPVVGAQGRAA